MTDLRLDEGDGSHVVIDSRVLKSTAADLVLDSPLRHTGRPGLRRALVHDQRDGLTINYNRDYPGGVTINDVVAMHSRSGMSVHDVAEILGAPKLPSSSGAGAKSTIAAGAERTLVVHGEIVFEPNPPQVSKNRHIDEALTGKTKAKTKTKTASLQQTLRDMQQRIDKLTERIAELERRI
jgi:hypothetical protein